MRPTIEKGEFSLTKYVFVLYSFYHEEKYHFKIQQKEKTQARVQDQDEHQGRQDSSSQKKTKKTKDPLCMIPGPSRCCAIRLTRASDYRRVYQQGRFSKRSLLRFHFLRTSGDKTRLGTSVSKRVIRTATGRTRAKRLVKEWFRQQGVPQAYAGCDIVISIIQPIAPGRQGAARLYKELEQALKKPPSTQTR